MALPACMLCEENSTAYLFTRLSDGDTIRICQDDLPAFLAQMIEYTLGVPVDTLMAVASGLATQENTEASQNSSEESDEDSGEEISNNNVAASEENDDFFDEDDNSVPVAGPSPRDFADYDS